MKCKVWNVGILFAASGMPNVSQLCCWLFEGVEDSSNCWQSWLNNVRLLPTWWNADGIIFGISQTLMIFGLFSKDMRCRRIFPNLWRALSDLCVEEVLQFLKSQVSLFIDWIPHFHLYKTFSLFHSRNFYNSFFFLKHLSVYLNSITELYNVLLKISCKNASLREWK